MIRKLTLLHLSDIHFRKPNCLDPAMDPDRPVRTALISDASSLCKTIGPVGAILVSGDIAFQADPEEYDVAAQWLAEVADATGCRSSDVFTVPGNHDVDRRLVRVDTMVQALRALLSEKSLAQRGDKLGTILRDTEAGPTLMRPMDSYNMFAARYDCAIYAPGRPFWTHDIPLDERAVLRVHGLTSTLLSGPEDEKGKLYLGPLQTVFEPVDGVIRLVMFHHPPEWFEDADEVDDALWNGAKLHLMGHKHKQRIRLDDAAVRLAAGAVNPSRFEVGWEPGYNMLEVRVIEEEARRWLEVHCHVRIWQSSPDRFIAKQTMEESPVFTKRIALGPALPKADSSTREKTMPGDESRKGKPMQPAPARDLVFRFWNLASSQRRDIANRLRLLAEGELSLPEFERYRIAFQRARERNLVDSLAEAIAQAERR